MPSWKQRYFVLKVRSNVVSRLFIEKGALLFYFETADAVAPKGCVFLKSNYKLIADARKDPHVFEIRPSEPGERVWVIAAPTREDKEVCHGSTCFTTHAGRNGLRHLLRL